MKEVKATPIANLIKKGIAASISYTEYKEKISALLATGMSTGKEQSEALTNYSMLNERRMKRLDKTLVIDQAIGAAIAEMEVDSTWLVITEGWCGDAAQSLPVLNKIAALNPGIDLRIVFRDQHLDLMDNFLTNKGRSIPKLIAYSKMEERILFTWGPRPSTATKMVEAFKQEHGSLNALFKQDLQIWYNKDKGKTLVNDFFELLKNHSE
ncbi:thioredoxin family protein [Aquimarina sp. W85]|uniref:thioredoxin family protein n=1 Tax=Aquimarina rhodophyticola TaxID=3342246 RepID=UPI0036711EF0